MANTRSKGSILPSIKAHILRVFKSDWQRVLVDGRSSKNQIWNFGYAMEVLLVGILSGAKTLREVETQSELYGERLPDTTLENLMGKVDASRLPKLIAEHVKEASRSHELDKKDLPFNLVAIDGKTNYSTEKSINEQSCKIKMYGQHEKYRHMNLRAMLVSSEVKPFLGERQIPGKSAETTELIPFVDELIELYGRTNLLQVISLDAGMAHRKNAAALKEREIDFIMGLKENQPTIYAKSQQLLGSITREKAKVVQQESYNGSDITYYFYRANISGNFASMPEVKQVWRIEKERLRSDGTTSIENRYYLTSLTQITARQCLRAVRAHWGIENNGNWTFDCVLGEDDYPLTTKAMSLVALLRILAYNCLVRFKYRRVRKKENREMSWKKMISFFQVALRDLRFEQVQSESATLAFV